MPAHEFKASEYAKFDSVNAWIETSLVKQDASLASCLEANATAQLEDIDVAPNEGKFHYLLAKMNKVKRVLEIGTLGGYSAIWFAKAVAPVGGKVITLEFEPEHAKVARSNIANAGFADVVEVRVGKALDTLKKMREDGEEGFDYVFIDADKSNNAGYLKYALEFAHVGTVIVVDNVVRQGKVLEDKDAHSEGQRKAFEFLKGEKRVECTALQTVGPKGWDGFAVAMVVE
ncbi:related to O-methyltransferase [Phialocephala subalpina]|uniref:Related to O-methyltransferase n=1 Tax=Phialocephala subalpina TaxID=576137 RepID=A0A1L7WFU6_9HELO|nr:related to O-methyltransferase [Phialocephala subalpina]